MRRAVHAVVLIAAFALLAWCGLHALIDRYGRVARYAPGDAAWVLPASARALTARAFNIDTDAEVDKTPVRDHDVALISHGLPVVDGPPNISREPDPAGINARLARAMRDAALGLHDRSTADGVYISYLLRQIRAMPGRYIATVSGRDAAYDAAGRLLPRRTDDVVDNRYARYVAECSTDTLQAGISIHPARPDAAHELSAWAAKGVRTLRWWPGAQHIRPAGAAARALYPVLAEHDMRLSLIVGGGQDRAGHRVWVAPTAVEAALAAGVSVTLRLGATRGPDGQQLMPALFALLRAHREDPELQVSVAGVLLRHRSMTTLVPLLQHPEFFGHLVYGSGYPDPAVGEAIDIKALADHGLIDAADVGDLTAIRRVNPLLFVFVTLRNVHLPGTRLSLPTDVFTRT